MGQATVSRKKLTTEQVRARIKELTGADFTDARVRGIAKQLPAGAVSEREVTITVLEFDQAAVDAWAAGYPHPPGRPRKKPPH
jgi:hypothetical protein